MYIWAKYSDQTMVVYKKGSEPNMATGVLNLQCVFPLFR